MMPYIEPCSYCETPHPANCASGPPPEHLTLQITCTSCGFEAPSGYGFTAAVARWNQHHKERKAMNDQQQKGMKPCRFCGGAATLEASADFTWVLCLGGCDMQGPARKVASSAIAAWNSLHAPAEPQREEGVVAWMDRSRWNVKGMHDVVVGEWCGHADYPMRVRIIPEPEPEPRPRYYAAPHGGGWGVFRGGTDSIVCIYWINDHPDPKGAACAEAERLNRGKEHGHD